MSETNIAEQESKDIQCGERGDSNGLENEVAVRVGGRGKAKIRAVRGDQETNDKCGASPERGRNVYSIHAVDGPPSSSG